MSATKPPTAEQMGRLDDLAHGADWHLGVSDQSGLLALLDDYEARGKELAELRARGGLGHRKSDLRWEGNRAMIGRVCVAHVWRDPRSGRWTATGVETRGVATADEAKRALETALTEEST